MNEKTLADKYSEYYNGFQLKDVKEFIKKLKEESFNDPNFSFGSMVVLIDKLAGKNLIGKPVDLSPGKEFK